MKLGRAVESRRYSIGGAWRAIANWFDNDAANAKSVEGVDWLRVLPFVALHIGCFGVFFVGHSSTAVAVAAALYLTRMFAITGFYHRYFSHRAFRTSRAVQFLFALLGATAIQRGPLWWASQHRHHHLHADEASDIHSVRQHGFVRSHIGWFLARDNFTTRAARIPDLMRFPELRFLDRFDVLMPALLALALYGGGELLATWRPELAVSGGQLLVWGLCISTIASYHATFTINSLAHSFGTRRYSTRDDSRNNGWLALLTRPHLFGIGGVGGVGPDPGVEGGADSGARCAVSALTIRRLVLRPHLERIHTLPG